MCISDSSQLPHAKIIKVNLEDARLQADVELALSGEDLQGVLPPISGMQVTAPKTWREGMDPQIQIPDQTLIPYDKLRYVGEPYALVVAKDRYSAEDAVELINTDFNPLEPVPNAEASAFGTGSNGLKSVFINSTASSAEYLSLATTKAYGSPTYRSLS